MKSEKNKKRARSVGPAAPVYPCLVVMTLADLKPAGYNPRTITGEALAQLRKSMDPENLGNLQPLTFNVRTKTLIGGHQRLVVLLERGDVTTPVWCVDLPLEKEKAANLALNNLAGEWDKAQLEAVLLELKGGDFDLSLTGFSEEALAEIVAVAGTEGTIKAVKPLAPPSRTWFLIGFPTVKMPALQPLIEPSGNRLPGRQRNLDPWRRKT